MHRCAYKFFGIADFLTDFYFVTFLHKRLAGGTDALRHGQYYKFGRGHSHGGHIGRVFMVWHMDAAPAAYRRQKDSMGEYFQFISPLVCC